MSNLPEDLIAYLLSHLPVKTLLRFRCVSKQWCALIDSPNFINLQLNQTLETNTNLSLICKYDFLYSVGLDSIDDFLKRGTNFYLIDKVKLEVDAPFESNHPWLLGSCNGLMCVLHSRSCENEIIMLLNPSTKKHLILPPVPSLDLYHRHGCYGIGYDPVNDDYKIIRVTQGFKSFNKIDHHHSEVWSYSLRSNLWRRVYDNFPYQLRHDYSGVLVNGALHWLAGRRPIFYVTRCFGDEFIVAFDPVAENYWVLQFPAISDVQCMTLGVLGGSLCLFCVCRNDFRDDLVELWVMKDYKEHESWTRLFKAFWGQIHGNINYCYSYIRILAYSKNWNEVLLQINGTMLWFDVKEQRVVDIGLCSLEAEICVASLVKLTG